MKDKTRRIDKQVVEKTFIPQSPKTVEDIRKSAKDKTSKEHAEETEKAIFDLATKCAKETNRVYISEWIEAFLQTGVKELEKDNSNLRRIEELEKALSFMMDAFTVCENPKQDHAYDFAEVIISKWCLYLYDRFEGWR